MSVGIIVLPVLILAALALGVLVYYICYKAAINRKLRKEESGAHVPMASTETVTKVVVIIGVVVMYCSLNSKIMNIQVELQNTTNRLYDEIMELRYELDEMRKDVKREASMISSVFYDFDKIDGKEHTVEMNFLVVPRSYSEQTKMTLNYRGETISFTNNGDGTFTGSAVFSMLEEYYEEGLFCVTENGVTKTEQWEDTLWGALKDACLPRLHIMYSTFDYRKAKDGMWVDGDVRLMSSQKDLSEFRDLTLLMKNGTTVLDEIVIEGDSITFDRVYPITNEDNISFYVKGVDKYGYIHELFVGGRSSGGASADVQHEVIEEYQVHTPDGDLLK